MVSVIMAYRTVEARPKMEQELTGRNAGGMATQRGIDFQNRVAAWFVTQGLAEQGGHKDLPSATLRRVYFETSEPVADLLLETTSDGFVFVEVKHAVSLAPTQLVPILRQFVRQWALCIGSQTQSIAPWRRRLNPEQDRLILVTAAQVPENVRRELANCLSRFTPEINFEHPIDAARTQAEQAAFARFLESLQVAWDETFGHEASDPELVEFLKAFRVKTLDVEDGHLEERLAVAALSPLLLEPEEGDSAWNSLLSLCATAASDRRSLTISELQQALQSRGIRLGTSPQLSSDVEKLRGLTRRTMRSLEHLARLRALPSDLSIKRTVTKVIEERASSSSLLIVGDPGAGKSGVLFELSQRLIDGGNDVVFIAVDRLEGSLQTELGLDHIFEDVLLRWTGRNSGYLIIDALDAARGHSASGAVLGLLRTMMRADSRWRIIASVRSFDLKYSPELKEVFRKEDSFQRKEHESEAFWNLNHVLIPRFTHDEMGEIQEQIPQVEQVIRTGSSEFTELLRTPFNLRLLCELLISGLSVEELTGLHTQTALLSRYWEHRVLSPINEAVSREQLLMAVLEAMRDNRRLSISKRVLPVALPGEIFTSLLSNQVLVEQEENVIGRYILCFSHHLLFDYAASRLLILSDPPHFLSGLAKDHDLILFLRPSLLLAFRELWASNRAAFWQLARTFEEASGIPSIARLIAPTILSERVHNIEDLDPLCELLNSKVPAERRFAEDWVLHAVGAMLADNHVRSPQAWAEFAAQVTKTETPERLLGALQALNSLLIEHLPNLRLYGTLLSRSACQLLNAISPREELKSWLRARAIADVMKTYAYDRELSSQTLRQLFTPQALRRMGFSDGPWLARGLRPLFELDAQFVEDFYIAVFAYDEESGASTPMSDGQIMPMTSNRRQDYHMMWWQLAQIFPDFCTLEPTRSARVAVAVLNSYVERDHAPKDGAATITWINDADQRQSIKGDYSSIWDSGYRDSHEEPLQIGSTFFRILQELTATDRELALDLGTIVLRASRYAVTVRRLFATSLQSPGTFVSILTPVCFSTTAMISMDLSSTIGEFLKLEFASLSVGDRKLIEEAIFAIPAAIDLEDPEIAIHIRDRVFGCLDPLAIVSDKARELILQLKEAGGAPENAPPFKMSGVYGGQYTARNHLQDRGVDVDAPANKRLMEWGERFTAFKGVHNTETPSIEDAINALPELREFRAAVDRWELDGVDRKQMLYGDSVLVAVCSSIAKNQGLDCTSELGWFVRETLLRGLHSEVPEHDPAYDAQFDDHQSWGSPAQRIDATAGLYSLAVITNCMDDQLREALQQGLLDKHPAVRFQAVTRLTWLHEHNSELMWSLIELSCESEGSIGVLSGLLSYALSHLSGKYPGVVIPLVQKVLNRFPIFEGKSSVNEWALRILAGLYIWQNRGDAHDVFAPLLTKEDFAPQAATQLLVDIRDLYTYQPDRGGDDGFGIRNRAFSLSQKVANLAQQELLDSNYAGESERLTQCAQTLNFIGNQLYFSSGAYDGTNGSNRGLDSHSLSSEERERFWHESQGTIEALTAGALPSIAHHLIQTLKSFVEFDPARVFHRIASVVESSRRFGYQYESMAVDLLVEITELYLAQYPALLQDDAQCRKELMAMLETFVTAGWPSALRLIYRLEDMYR
jgi:hypothetical protein